VNRANSVASIVLAGEQHLRFRLAQVVFELCEQRLEFLERTLVFFRKLKEHSGVIQLRLEMSLAIDLLFQPAAVL
jgi:type II secretory pathway predicted ATPase ExeA